MVEQSFQNKRVLLDKNFGKAAVKLYYPIKPNVRALIPLASSFMNCTIFDGLAQMELTFNFQNKSTESITEVTFEFPNDENTLISQLSIKIGESREVEAEITRKEQAQRQYDNAIKKNQQASLMTKSKDGKGITLLIGNLQPQEFAKVLIKLSKFVEIEGGAYAFKLPVSYFPDYNLNDLDQTYAKDKLADNHDYTFDYKIEIKSANQITKAYVPSYVKQRKSPDGKSFLLENKPQSNIPKSDLTIHYQTQNMDVPQCKYQLCEKYQNEVAILTSFIPSQINIDPQDNMIILEDVEPENIFSSNTKYLFVFLIDRSLSMLDGVRMKTARDALLLFMQSLPENSAFQIISFGGQSFDPIEESKEYIEYNDVTKTKAVNEIKLFKADYLGTNIYKPLEMAYDIKEDDYKKNIFLLTDGEVQEPDEIVNFVKQTTNQVGCTARTHTFAIGDNCDVKLCSDIAQVGRGTFSLAPDGSPDLRRLVIQALKKSCLESLQQCQMSWNDQTQNYGEIFSTDLFTSMKIMQKQEFEKLQVSFYSQKDPRTEQSISIKFEKEKFVKMQDGDELFKHATHQKIKQQKQQNGQDLSSDAIKYQVLSDSTAMVALIKTEIQSKGEVSKQYVKFGEKEIAQEFRVDHASHFSASVNTQAQRETQDIMNQRGHVSGVLQNLFMNESADDIDEILLLREMRDLILDYGHTPPEDIGEQTDLLEEVRYADENQTNFIEEFIQLFTVLKIKLHDGSYHKEEAKRIPTMQEFIVLQESKGNWTEESDEIMKKQLIGKLTDQSIQDELKKINEQQATSMWYTLLALHILQNLYEDSKDEWQLIAIKAKRWLIKMGLEKPKIYLEKIKFAVKQQE